MEKMTAIEWLVDNLPIRFKNALINECSEEIEQAKQMEKEQQFRFFVAGQISMEEGGKSFDQYYSKTYGKDSSL